MRQYNPNFGFSFLALKENRVAGPRVQSKYTREGKTEKKKLKETIENEKKKKKEEKQGPLQAQIAA